MSDGELDAKVSRLERRIRALEQAVGQLSRRREILDSRLGPLLAQIFAFAHESPWTASELLSDAARVDRPLWFALDAIVGRGNSAAISLGRWLERHAGLEIDGYRLQRHKKEGNAWLYSSVKVGLGELAA